MGADHHIHPAPQLLLKGGQHPRLVEYRSLGHPDGEVPPGTQGAGDGVVLIAGDEHRGARTHQGMNGQIERMGGVVGEHHLLWIGYIEELGRRLPQSVEGVRCPHPRPMSASARAGHMCHGPCGGRGHRDAVAEGTEAGFSMVVAALSK